MKNQNKYLIWGSMRKSTSRKERIRRPTDATEMRLTHRGTHSIVSWLRVGVWKPNFWPEILGFPSISYLAVGTQIAHL